VALGGLATAGLLLAGWPSDGQSMQHLGTTHPGGLPGAPVMTGISAVSNGVSLTWDGPSGYYQIFQKQSLKDAKWQAMGKATNLLRRATITTLSSNVFFRVAGPAPNYAGAQACAGCHATTHNTVMNTRHAQAFQTLKSAHQETNSSCLPCHTVGYGLPTGFISETKTPQLEGVQCENCHGPAANHAANETDMTFKPRVEVAATLCGGCHDGAHHPTFTDWASSKHVECTIDLNTTDHIDSCGRCHSGSVRVNLLKREPLPMGDANVHLGCVVCHDPHQTNGYPAQLRNPVCSTNDYFMATSGSFLSQYNPSINLCAQCHNHCGASWTNSSAPPHGSAQYNLLLGTIGELPSGLPHSQPAAHALLITNQCAECHMQTAAYQSETVPAVTGHSFKISSYAMCMTCHPYPDLLVQFTTEAVSYQIQQVKAGLDLWAATKAPSGLWANYGTRAWEYTLPGGLSAGGAGPATAEQAQIPVNIQKARFNLYLVYNEGSFGIHNGPYAVSLLDAANDWIQSELNKGAN
jgi:cytochrome c554/c'-like protein